MPHDITEAQFARFGRQAAAILGTSAEWDADHLEYLDQAATVTLGIPVGDQDDDLLRYWRTIADTCGVHYDTDDEEGDEE